MKHLVFLLLGMILVLSCSSKDNKGKPKVDNSPGVDGIDISHWNNVDWNRVDSAFVNLKFVFIKATEGSTYKDPKFKAHLKNARKHHYLAGAYHHFTTTSSAKDQFYHYYKVVGNDIDLIPAIDFESNRGHKSAAEIQKELRVFADLCIKYYHKSPIIYVSDERLFHTCNRVLKDKFNDCIIWTTWLYDKWGYPPYKKKIIWQLYIQRVENVDIDCNKLYNGLKLSDISLKKNKARKKSPHKRHARSATLPRRSRRQ